MRILYVIDTHLHADHVSAGRALAEAAGAEYVLSANADAAFPFKGVRDGDELELGNVVVKVLHTPGHTPEHISLVVTDRTRSAEPWFVLTGHTLMVGDLGRTELATSAEEGARALFRSAQVLKALPDHLEVLPGAYSGSVCGRGLSGKPTSTIGFEKLNNRAFRIEDEEEFVRDDARRHPAGAARGRPDPRDQLWPGSGRCMTTRAGFAGESVEELAHGIRENLEQFLHQLLQVLLVGFAIGMMRTVVPALAESEFGVARGSFLLLTAFVVAFGVVKGVLNFVAGRLSERIGRKQVLLLGWLFAVPIPVMIYFAPSWSWIVAATVLLGVNQGLCWSMTQTAKLDITRPDQRGLTIGLNEFSGYVGVALAGIITGYAATALGPRLGLLVFGLAVVLAGLVLAQVWVRDTLPWAHAEAAKHARAAPGAFRPRYPAGRFGEPDDLGGLHADVLARPAARRDLSGGLVEKFVDALVWVIFPVFLYQHGVSLPDIGWIVGVYGFVWGGSQLFTGRLSDHVGRRWPNVLGMWICGGGVALFLLGDGVPWWSFAAGVAGFGMALLYPNLSAAVADISPPAWRGSAIGIYRFWRDLGYGIGALGLGLAAHFAGVLDAAFWFVAVSMFLSGGLLWWWGEETHPRLNPAAA